MRYELHAVSFRDRLVISFRYIAVAFLAATGIVLVLLLGAPGVAERSFWMLLFAVSLAAAFEIYRAIGYSDSGFVDITDTTLTRDMNDTVEVVHFDNVTQAISFNILGNRTIILEVGNAQIDILYSAYSTQLIEEFRRILGPRLKEGLFAWWILVKRRS